MQAFRLFFLTAAAAPLAVLVMVASASAAEAGMSPAIEQCLRDNAAKVEASEPDLTKATDYLVSEACAQPVADEQQRINQMRTQQMAERNRALCEDRVAQQKKQAETNPGRTGLVPASENCDLQYNNLIANNFNPLILGLPAKSPAATSMAAKLILDLRVAHTKARP